MNKMLRRFVLLALVLVLAALPVFAQDDAEDETDDTVTFVDFRAEIDNGQVLVYGIDEDGNVYLLSVLPLDDSATAEQGDMDDAPVGSGYLIVNTSFLNLRSGPGVGYTIVGSVSGSSELSVIGRTGNRVWWYVEYGGVRGWVNGTLTIVRGDLTGVPVVEADGEYIQPTLVVGYAGNPIYGSLEAGSSVVCTLPGNSEHLLVGRSAGGSWWQIQVDCNGTTVTGWIEKDKGVVRNPAELPIPITYR